MKSVYFKELHNEQEYYCPTIYRAGAAAVSTITTVNPGSVIVPQYGSSKITVFVWGKNTILKFLGNTK